MATSGRARRARGGGTAFVRPLASLRAASLALLLLRDTAAIRGVSIFATEFLVPAERVLGAVGSSVSGFWQSIAEIENLRSDNKDLHAQVDRLAPENVQLREQAFQAQQAAQLPAAAKGLQYQTVAGPGIARDH